MKELRYADDATPITKLMEEMTEMLRKVVEESAKLGLKLNLTKTNKIVIGQIVN